MSQYKENGNYAPQYWTKEPQEIISLLKSDENGLSEDEAEQRQKQYGPNSLKGKSASSTYLLFLGQFKNPITLILIAAAILSFILQDKTDAVIILIIVFISSGLGFWQEYGASNAVAKLLQMVQITVQVLREGISKNIPTENIVPGDIVILSAGDIIPADSIILSSQDLFVDEAAFTGESYPVEKLAGSLPENTTVAKRSNMLFMGSHVISGKGKVLVVSTGMKTEFGKISDHLRLRAPETEFERGVKKFGFMLMQITLILIIIIFAMNVLLHKPILDAFLFSLALAVGLTPQLLPVIISVNLSAGAKKMAAQQVIVKRLAAIENFGSMNILCSDKTGTITQGQVKLYKATDVNGKDSEQVIRYAWLNASLQQGFKNPIDQAVIETYQDTKTTIPEVLDEVPYDFLRKRLSMMLSIDGKAIAITKGAFKQIMEVCTFIQKDEKTILPLSDTYRDELENQYENFSRDGYRTLGICWKNSESHTFSKNDEKDMVFLGFVTFFDPPKESAIKAINNLNGLGVKLKIITGDNALIAATLAKQVGMQDAMVIKGSELQSMSNDALMAKASQADIFAEVEPNQKEQIILALKKAGHVVGFMGDGINDAAALHSADVGISVDTAVDVAKEAADLVLMNQDLEVLINGIKEGRKTFANTMKYVFMATSANFGNMFSMAGASLILPFLPLLPKQILLTNLLTDIPETTIATDNVDESYISKPHRMDIRFIKRFMLVFGLLSSVFDYCTFGVLLLILKTNEQQFQTGWFLESVISASLIVLVVRTQKPFFKSLPSTPLWVANLIVIVVVLVLPFTPIGKLFGFVELPVQFYFYMALIVTAYIITADYIKKWFYKKLAPDY